MKTFEFCKRKIVELNQVFNKIERKDPWYPEIEDELEKALYLSELLTLSVRKFYTLDYTPNSNKSKSRFKKITKECINVSVSIESEDAIVIEFPLICNKKKEETYLRDSLSIGLAPFFKEPLLLKERVVVIEYVYSKNENDYFRLDYDNTEIRSILNVLTRYILVDDAPECYSLHCCYKEEAVTKTRIYVFSKECFGEWLKNKEAFNG